LQLSVVLSVLDWCSWILMGLVPTRGYLIDPSTRARQRVPMIECEGHCVDRETD
jgi:hypothetical protein